MNILKKYASFVIVGAISIVIELIFFNIFFFYLSFPISRIFALTIALSANFNLNRNFTFKAKSKKKKDQFPKFLTTYTIATTVNYVTSLLVVSILPKTILNANVATLTGIAIAAPITFFCSLLWTFKT